MSASYITDGEGNVVYPKTLAKCVNKGGSTLEEYLNDVEDATLIKPTVSGTDMVLTDSSNMNIQELHLFGKTEQKKTKGIQLLDFSKAKGGTNGGITYTQNGDGTFKRVGTATSNSGNVWLFGDYIAEITDKNVLMILEAGKQYFVKDCAVFMGTTIITAGGGETINVLESKYPEGIKVTGIRNPDVVLNRTYNDIIYPIIAESSTAVDWEEYTGEQPSPSPDYPQEIKSIENPTVSVAGKNLFEPSTINYSYNNLRITANVDNSQKNSIKIKINTINATEGDLYALAYVDINKFVKKIKSNTTYTIVLKNPQNIGAVFVGTIIGTNRITNTVAVKSNVIKLQTIDDISNKSTFPLVFYFAGTVKENVTIGFDDIAVYEGEYSNAEIEEYKPIQSATLNYTLNGIDDVKDELIVRADGTGQLIQRLLEEELNDNSNYVIWYANTNTYGFLMKESKWLFRANKINIKSNKLKGITKEVGNSGAYDKNGIFVDTAGLYIKISKKYLTEYTVDALKTYLRDNPITVVGLLKEPIVTNLSAEEVQKILNLHTNKTNTTIWNDQNAEMQVTYVADTKKYIDDKFTELENSVCGGLLITDNLIDNSNMLNNTALTISDKISTSSNSTYKTYLNIPVKAGESYYIGKSHRNSCIIDSIENKKVLQSNMVNQADSYIFNVNYDGFLCVCFYTTEQNPKIALLTREKTES